MTEPGLLCAVSHSGILSETCFSGVLESCVRGPLMKKLDVFFLSCSGNSRKVADFQDSGRGKQRKPEPGQVLCAHLHFMVQFPSSSWTCQRTKACLRKLPESAGGLQFLVWGGSCGAPRLAIRNGQSNHPEPSLSLEPSPMSLQDGLLSGFLEHW